MMFLKWSGEFLYFLGEVACALQSEVAWMAREDEATMLRASLDGRSLQMRDAVVEAEDVQRRGGNSEATETGDPVLGVESSTVT